MDLQLCQSETLQEIKFSQGPFGEIWKKGKEYSDGCWSIHEIVMIGSQNHYRSEEKRRGDEITQAQQFLETQKKGFLRVGQQWNSSTPTEAGSWSNSGLPHCEQILCQPSHNVASKPNDKDWDDGAIPPKAAGRSSHFTWSREAPREAGWGPHSPWAICNGEAGFWRPVSFPASNAFHPRRKEPPSWPSPSYPFAPGCFSQRWLLSVCPASRPEPRGVVLSLQWSCDVAWPVTQLPRASIPLFPLMPFLAVPLSTPCPLH